MSTRHRDSRGIWMGRLLRRRDRAAAMLDTAYARSYATLWGIELGEGCVFYGRPVFRRPPGSTLSIARNCVFRSAHWSNLAGVNRPCMVTTLRPGARLHIGRDCGFSGTVIAAADEVVIGDRVFCGANVTVTDTDWHGVHPGTRHEDGEHAAVRISNDVWLGLNVVVLKGVTIGEATVVSAGSVVSKSLPPGVIAAGQPAAVIREL